MSSAPDKIIMGPQPKIDGVPPVDRVYVSFLLVYVYFMNGWMGMRRHPEVSWATKEKKNYKY